jgi:uncharacterized DUF497 family protein
MSFVFEWDESKAIENFRKHGVSFDEAKTVLLDPLSMTIPDPDHSNDEDRFIDIGRSIDDQILVVVYTERRKTIRLISCRKATSSERKSYEEGQF